MFPEVLDLWGAVDHVFIVIIAFKVWITVYGLYLIGSDVFLTLFPTTLFGAGIIYGIISHYRIPPAEPWAVKAVFGDDVNLLIEEYEKEGGQTAPNGLLKFPFIPTTSRLSKALAPEPSSNTSILPSASHSDIGGSRQPYTMWIVGHRGAGLDAPENSLSAFRLCKSRGCTAVEFDVALTKDHVPVVFHDDTLTRVAGIDRNIREMTYGELMEADISATHPLGEKYRGERIPTLQEAITTCLGLDLRFFIDLKESDPIVRSCRNSKPVSTLIYVFNYFMFHSLC